MTGALQPASVTILQGRSIQGLPSCIAVQTAAGYAGLVLVLDKVLEKPLCSQPSYFLKRPRFCEKMRRPRDDDKLLFHAQFIQRIPVNSQDRIVQTTDNKKRRRFYPG
jgi:hypothetical protein